MLVRALSLILPPIQMVMLGQALHRHLAQFSTLHLFQASTSDDIADSASGSGSTTSSTMVLCCGAGAGSTSSANEVSGSATGSGSASGSAMV